MGKPLLSRGSKCLVGGDTAEGKCVVRRQYLKCRKSGETGGGQGSGWSWRSFSQKVPSRAHKKMPSFHLGTRWAHVLCADAV